MKKNKDRTTYISSKQSKLTLVSKPSSYTAALEENAILRDYLEKTIKLPADEIRKLLDHGREILLPLSIFKNDLSTLEVLVKFLHEDKNLPFVEIGALLHRDQRTIWHAYRRAVKKKVSLIIENSAITIPISIFASRKYAPLETLVGFLKESCSLTLTEIAAHLHLSPKTIWTVHDRYLKKKHDR